MTQLLSHQRVLPTYARLDVTFTDGEGSWLTDADGKRYLALFAGIAVVGLGHKHPAPLAAAHAQLDKLWHASNLYVTEPQVRLAEKLTRLCFADRAFFANSGARTYEDICFTTPTRYTVTFSPRFDSWPNFSEVC